MTLTPRHGDAHHSVESGATNGRRLVQKPQTTPGPSRARDKAQHIRVWSIGDEGPQHHVNQAAGMLSRGESKTILICVAETFFPRSDDDVRGKGALAQGIPDNDNTDDDMGSDEFEERHGLTFPHSRFPIIRNCTVG